MRAVFLDVMGTLLDLVSPGDALVDELRRTHDIELEELQARRAFDAEIRYYRSHHLRGRDRDSLAELRMRCAEVLHANLPDSVRERIACEELLQTLRACLRFRVFAEVQGTLVRLRQRELVLIALSNWDISLADVLDDLGLLGLLDGVVSSAEVGHPKPAREIFTAALELAGVSAGEALHVGDSPELDVRGARDAGIAAVLLCRGQGSTRMPATAVPRISSLERLPELACA